MVQLVLLLALAAGDPAVGGEHAVDQPLIRAGQGIATAPAIGVGPGGALVVFIDDRRGQLELWANRLAPSGALLEPTGFRISDSHLVEPNPDVSPAVACTQTRCLVAWQRGSSARADVMMRRVDLDGRVVDAEDLPLAAEPGHFEGVPLVTTDGTDFVVFWADRRDTGLEIVAGRVRASDGSKLDGNGVALGLPFGGSHAVATGAGGFLLATVSGNGDVALVPVSAGLVPGSVRTLGVSRTQAVALASDGTHYLLARQTLNFATYPEMNVLATRVDALGARLDLADLPIATAADRLEYLVAVGTNGEHFVVLWREEGELPSQEGLYGLQVGPRPGAALGAPRLLSAGRVGGTGASTFEGDAVLVAYRAHLPAARTDVRVLRLDDAGVPLGAPLAASQRGHHQTTLALSPSAGGFFVAWQDRRDAETTGDDLYGLRLDAHGEPSGAPFAVAAAPGEQTFPAAAGAGELVLVVWHDDRAGRSEIRGARVRTTGEVLDPAGFVIAAAPTTLVPSFSFPTVASDGEGFLVAWAGLSAIHAARVAADGSVSPSVTVTEQLFPLSIGNVVFAHGEFFLVYAAQTATSDEVRSARLATDGRLLATDVTAITGGIGKVRPLVAFDGERFLVVWTDRRNQGSQLVDAPDVYAARLDASGASLDGDGLPLTTAAGSQSEPDVAFDGAAFQVTWFSYESALETSVHRAVVDSTGAVVSTRVVLDTPRQRQVSSRIAFDAAGRGVLGYERFEEPANSVRLRVRALDSSRDEPDAGSDGGTGDGVDGGTTQRPGPASCGCGLGTEGSVFTVLSVWVIWFIVRRSS